METLILFIQATTHGSAAAELPRENNSDQKCKLRGPCLLAEESSRVVKRVKTCCKAFCEGLFDVAVWLRESRVLLTRLSLSPQLVGRFPSRFSKIYFRPDATV